MYSKEVLNELALADRDVGRRTRKKIEEILQLAEKSRHLSAGFTFKRTGGTDREVNRILALLSEEIIEDSTQRASRAIEEAGDEEDRAFIIPAVKERLDARGKLDAYSSHLKSILEGWIAIGFANRLSKGTLMTHILAYMDNPYVSPMWKQAFREGDRYAAGIIRGKGYRWGKGTLLSPKKGMTLVEQDIINTAYQEGVIGRFKKDGAIGYRVHRGSFYDCPVCDALCEKVHPISSMALPAHPRCVCYATPVFDADGEAGLFMIIQEREKKYKALLNNPNYKDIEFNKTNGGLKATHIYHNLDKKGGIYELQVQNAGYNKGFEVILENERFKGFGERSTEGTWNGKLFEVAGKETATSNNLLKGLKHCADKKTTQIAILDFPNGGFDRNVLANAIRRYKGLEKQNDGQFVLFERIICVQDEKIVYDEPL